MKTRGITAFAVPLLFALFPILSAASPLSEGTEPREISVTARDTELSPSTITISKGEQVKLVIGSEAADFDLIVSDLGIRKRILKGQSNIIEMSSEKAGRFALSSRAGDRQDAVIGELVVSEVPARHSNMRVTFDPAAPGIVIVESGDERIRVDTLARTVEAFADRVTPASQQAQSEQPPPQPTRPRESSKDYEPYDYRIVNIPTPKRVRRNSLNLYFTHRFQEQITSFENERSSQHIARISKDLLGLDSVAVSSFGLTYGITDRLYASVYRSPLCQQGLCKTIELGFGYHLVDEAGRSPVALSAYASVEGDHNFTERYTWNFQAMIARSITKYVNVFFSPAAHVNSNGGDRFKEFLASQPLAAGLRLGQHAGSFGFGVNARIRPTASLLFEYTPRVGFRMG